MSFGNLEQASIARIVFGFLELALAPRGSEVGMAVLPDRMDIYLTRSDPIGSIRTRFFGSGSYF